MSQDSKKTWDYPIKPRTEEWKKLESNKAKVEACQIPKHILQDISTDALMTLCLEYPLLYDVFAFNNTNNGLSKLFSDFNGIREFSKREGAINNLSEQYLSEIRSLPENLNNRSNLEIGYSVARISILEVLLSYSDFHSNTSKENQKKILENLLFGYREKIKYPEYFQGNGFATNLFARAHIIIKIDTVLSEKFEKENKVVLFSGMADADLINIIDSLSNILSFNSCEKESEKEEIDDTTISACGVTDPAKKLTWLAELIETAKTDETGNYLGRIWLEKFKEQDVFVTDMMLGSGGVAYWFFDCSGNHLILRDWKYEICPACNFVGNHHFFIEDEDFQSFVSNMKLDVIIYSPF